MTILIRPVPSRNKLNLIVPIDGIQFHYNELLKKAATKRWSLEIVQTPNPWLTVKFTDSRNNVNQLEVFNRTYTKYQCTCGMFVSDQSGFCLHTAAFDNLCRNRAKFGEYGDADFSAFTRELDRALMRLPEKLAGYRTSHFNFYNAYKQTTRNFGNDSMPVVDSVTVAANNRRDNRIASVTEPLFYRLDGENLLNGVTLFDYQRNIFAKMVTAKRAICSMVMGAGKTLTTIACYSWIRKYHKPNARLLVICPKSLRIQWANEIKRVTDLDSTQVMRAPDLNRDTPVFIATYQWYAQNHEVFLQQNFDVLVADEIQYVRNSESKTWKALSKIRTEYFYGLSGTVIENRLDDLYSIMQIVAPGALGPSWRFNHEYQNLTSVNPKRIFYNGVKNIEQLQDRLRNYVFSYSALTLPSITYHDINIELDSAQTTMHNEFMKQATRIIARSMNGSPSPRDMLVIQGLLLKARQSCNAAELVTKEESDTPSAKVEAFINLVNNICVRRNEKLVVFSEWTEMLSLCKRFLPRGIGYVSYTGAQSAEKRAANLARFQSDPNCKIFFSSDAGGVGLDGLQLVSHNIVHLELPWNPSRLDQRTGRVWRIRQTNPVNCYYIVSNGGIEQRIKTVLDDKRNIRTTTLNDLV